MNKLSLIQIFSLISLVVIITVAFAFGHGVTRMLQQDMFQYSLQEVEKSVLNNVTKHFRQEHFTIPRSDSEYRQFSNRIEHLSIGPFVQKIKGK